MSDAAWIALAGLVLNLLVVVVGGTWALGRSNNKVYLYIDGKVKELEDKLSEGLKTTGHDFGETVSAVREHTNKAMERTNQVELFVRDHYLSLDMFKMFFAEFKENWGRFEAGIYARFDRIESRHDQ